MDVSKSGSPKPPPIPTLKSLEDPQQRRIEPVDGTQDILVFWDIEASPLSSESDSSPNCAPSLLRELQCRVTCDQIRVTINVYGTGGPGSKAGLDSLIAGGITLQHRILPCKQRGSETAALKTMMVDIALWALSNPAPRNLFLISATSDTSFRDLINGLHMRDYHIHLATKFSFGSHESTEQTQPHDLFHPMPRHWNAPKQLFVARTAQSRLESSPATPLEKLRQLNLNR